VHHYVGLLYLALPLLLLYMIVVRSRRQQRTIATTQASIRPGSRVMTTSGIHATVVSIEDDLDIVVLEIAPGVHTRWARPAIGQIFDDDQSFDDEQSAGRSPSDRVVDLSDDSAATDNDRDDRPIS
jgi:preprotein translocase subunit YajC